LPRLASARLRRYLTLAAAVLVLCIVTGAAGYVTSPQQKSLPATQPSDPAPTFVRGVLQSVAADRLSISTEAGTVEYRMRGDTTVEALRAIRAASLMTGDWVNAGAIGHAQTLFALVGLVVIPSDQLDRSR
jgi:hypothetical protein